MIDNFETSVVLGNALAVIMLDPLLRKVLYRLDRKAWQQAQEALTLAGFPCYGAPVDDEPFGGDPSSEFNHRNHRRS